jgi:hypothetical protein
MTTPEQTPETPAVTAAGPYSAEEIEQMIREDDIDPDDVIEAKIQEAIAKAAAAGQIDLDKPVLVGIDPTSGAINVLNGDDHDGDDHEGIEQEPDDGERLPEFKLPDSFFQRSESLADNPRQLDHFEKHWGF